MEAVSSLPQGISRQSLVEPAGHRLRSFATRNARRLLGFFTVPQSMGLTEGRGSRGWSNLIRSTPPSLTSLRGPQALEPKRFSSAGQLAHFLEGFEGGRLHRPARREAASHPDRGEPRHLPRWDPGHSVREGFSLSEDEASSPSTI